MVKKTGGWWGIYGLCFLAAWFLSPANQSSGAPVPGGPSFQSIGSYEFKPLYPSMAFNFTAGRIYNTTND